MDKYYMIKSEQEYYAISNLLDKFNYMKYYNEHTYSYSAKYQLVLDTSNKKYLWSDNRLFYSGYTKCENFTELYNQIKLDNNHGYY